ncbi:MAG: hypothetical protein UY95_C0034G0005 [Parcubacteria group bacterium GW2011_GWA2_56_7]|nr:MAG: hypothetical protein UY95_C0034G0005 [Parcubacteria group bacterium GW2011_GWA2_56_7]
MPVRLLAAILLAAPPDPNLAHAILSQPSVDGTAFVVPDETAVVIHRIRLSPCEGSSTEHADASSWHAQGEPVPRDPRDVDPRARDPPNRKWVSLPWLNHPPPALVSGQREA